VTPFDSWLTKFSRKSKRLTGVFGGIPEEAHGFVVGMVAEPVIKNTWQEIDVQGK